VYKTQIDQTQVKAFVDAYFKNPVSNLAVVNSGAFSQAYAFENSGDPFIVRFNSHTGEGFRKEAIIYAEYADIPTPRIIDIGVYQGLHYSLTVAYGGLQLHKLDRESMEAVLPSLFETMNTIHGQKVKSGGFGLWGLDQKATLSSFEDQLRRFIHEAKWEAWAKQYPFFDIRFAQKLKAEFENLVKYIPSERYFLHGDFGRTNIFALDNRIEGVIDWSEAMYGDFLLDLSWCAFWENKVDMIAAYYHFNRGNSRLNLRDFEARVRLYLIFSALNNMVFEVARGSEDLYQDAVLATRRNLGL
jgi:hygromycin-B 4-O-kinase